jgi:hypothetical protein
MLRMFVGEVSSCGGGKKILDVCLPTKNVLDEPWEVVRVDIQISSFSGNDPHAGTFPHVDKSAFPRKIHMS